MAPRPDEWNHEQRLRSTATCQEKLCMVVLPLSGSEPIPNLNQTRAEPQFRFRQRQRTGPNPRCGSGFEDCWISLNLSEHVQTCANLKFSLLQITIFAKKKSRTRTVLASTEVP
jgi:hypothetical protein